MSSSLLVELFLLSRFLYKPANGALFDWSVALISCNCLYIYIYVHVHAYVYGYPLNPVTESILSAVAHEFGSAIRDCSLRPQLCFGSLSQAEPYSKLGPLLQPSPRDASESLRIMVRSSTAVTCHDHMCIRTHSSANCDRGSEDHEHDARGFLVCVAACQHQLYISTILHKLPRQRISNSHSELIWCGLCCPFTNVPIM